MAEKDGSCGTSMFTCPNCQSISDYEKNVFIIFNFDLKVKKFHCCNLITYGFKCPIDNCNYTHTIIVPSRKLIDNIQASGNCLFNYKCTCSFENKSVTSEYVSVPQGKVKTEFLSHWLPAPPYKVYQTECAHCKQLQYLDSSTITPIDSVRSQIGDIPRCNVYIKGLYWGYNSAERYY